MRRRFSPGVVLSVLLSGLLIAMTGCAALETPIVTAPAAAALASPTSSPSASATQAPTVTDQPIATSSAALSFTATPTGAEEAARLAAAAAAFQADTPEQLAGVLVALGEEEASHVDGPLALAILEQAGWLSPEVAPHLFWLLNFSGATERMEQVFPRALYAWRLWTGSIAAIDFTTDGLLPGDLIYLVPAEADRAGKFLLVTRVDDQGRAFSTTNLYQPGTGSYTIEETALYDPDEAGQGLFAGLGEAYRGLLLVRKRDYTGQDEGQAALNQILNQGGIWQVVVKPVGGAAEFSRDAGEVIHPASVIKLPLAMLVVNSLMAQEGDLTAALAGSPPGAGRSYGQLLRAMLVYSEETATDLLEHDLTTRVGDEEIRRSLDAWGAVNTTLEPRRMTAHEAALLWEGLYDRSLLGEPASSLLLGYLAEKTEGDAVRLWKLVDRLPAGATIYNKRGSLTDPMIVADSGILALPDGRAYVICLFGEADDWTGFEGLDAAIGEFAVAWYEGYLADAPSP